MPDKETIFDFFESVYSDLHTREVVGVKKKPLLTPSNHYTIGGRRYTAYDSDSLFPYMDKLQERPDFPPPKIIDPSVYERIRGVYKRNIKEAS